MGGLFFKLQNNVVDSCSIEGGTPFKKMRGRMVEMKKKP